MKRADPGTARKSRARALRWAALAIFLALAALGAWSWWVFAQIERYAGEDSAAKADAICVLGAAEYDGKPSPILRARLDQARSLYNRGIAPLIITTGGGGGDEFSEGAVGRDYLMATGVPEDAIIAETKSKNSEESARRVGIIAHANGLHKLVIVSDPTHLFRIHEIFAAQGLDVLTSPRQREASEDPSQDAGRIVHEIFAYTLWRVHLH
jgi:uncharacterized SAM-binding protein YcdF (DUF218 family)